MKAPTSLLCLALALQFISYKSHALQKYERVLVKGQKQQNLRVQNSYESSLNQEDLKNFNINHSDDLWSFIPNLNTAGGSNRLRFIQIRGIGERSEFDSVPTNSVGFYYDHIDLSGLGGIVATYDVESFQVLKGPQSHIFGDSSIGGNILIRSNSSSFKNRTFWGELGSQNQHRLGFNSTTPLTEDLSFKIGLQKFKSDGFFENSFLNKKTNKRDELFSNMGLSYIGLRTHIKTSHIFADQKNGYDVFQTKEDPFTTVSDRPGRDFQTTYGHSLELTHFINSKNNISLITSLSDHNIEYSFDEDWGNNAFWNSLPGWNQNYDFNRIFLRDRTNTHAKIIYQNTNPLGLLDFGVHYTKRADESDITSFENGLERNRLLSDFSSEHFSYFSSLAHDFNKSLSLSLSGRVEKQQITYSDSNNFKAYPSTDLFGFLVSVEKKTNRNSFKARISRGYKGAGFNPEQNLTKEQQFYGAESLLNYEVTWLHQSKLLDNRLNLFYMDRSNQQIQTSTQENPNDPSDFTVFIDNAAKSENYGLENELTLFPYKPFSLKLNIGLLKARFKEHQNQGVDFSGREMAHAPSYTYSLSSLIKIRKNLNLNINISGRDSFFFSNSHDQISNSYSIVNASLLYAPSKQFVWSLWARNLLDKRYSTRGFFFGNEPPDFSETLYTQPGAPLEWGLKLTCTFSKDA